MKTQIPDYTVGDKIRWFREQKKMSLQQLNEISGVSFGFLGQIERNEVHVISLDKLDKIGQALGTDAFGLLKNTAYAIETVRI